MYALKLLINTINPIWNEGGSKNAPSLVFFFKYLQNEKRYDFALLWLLLIIYFEGFCQVSRETFDWLTSYCDFVRGVPKNSKTKKIFFNFFFNFFFFFWNNFFCKIFQVYIMSKWYIWFFSYEITFSYWYLKTNFVVFLSEIMELTSDRFFYLLCKAICFYLFIFFFLQ